MVTQAHRYSAVGGKGTWHGVAGLVHHHTCPVRKLVETGVVGPAPLLLQPHLLVLIAHTVEVMQSEQFNRKTSSDRLRTNYTLTHACEHARTHTHTHTQTLTTTITHNDSTGKKHVSDRLQSLTSE